MPLHDHSCPDCCITFEAVVKWDEREARCPDCGKMVSRSYLSFNGIKKEDPNWLRDTLEVVDKDGGQHCQDFLKNPTRSNYHGWMKGEGLRPLEEGEPMKLKKRNTSERRSRVMENFKKNNKLTVRSQA